MNTLFRKLRILQAIVALLWFENNLAATCERGNRLISEAGGASAISGTAAPENAQNLAGAVGISDPDQTPPFETIPTIPANPGILDFADFYAIMPEDNPGPIFGGVPVSFPRTGSSTGGIKRVDSFPNAFELSLAGTYLVLLQGTVSNAGQLMIALNALTRLDETRVGRSAGNTQIVGFGLINVTANNTMLTVINSLGNPPVFFAPNVNGSPVTAHLIIIRIQ